MATAIPSSPFQPDRASLSRPLAEPSMVFDLERELEALRRESAWRRNRHNARTLAKYADLRIVLVAAQPGVCMKPHEPHERIAVQVVHGRIRILAGEQGLEVGEGQLVALDKSMAHQIEALEESAFLLHVSWPA